MGYFGKIVGKYVPEYIKSAVRPIYPKSIDNKISDLYFRVQGEKIIQTEFGFELQIDMTDYVQRRYIFWTEDSEELSIFRTAIEETEGDFIDVGSNVGFYAIYFNRLSEGDRDVFAFEPLRYNVEKLEKNLEINNINNIEVFEYGLSSKNTQYQLRFSESNRGGASTSKLSGDKSEMAEFRRMDEIRTLTSAEVGIIKIDVEGGEMDVIKGGEKYLQEQKPRIIIEIHPDLLSESGYSVESLCSKLSCLGYNTIYNNNQNKKLEDFTRRQMDGDRHFIVE